MQILRQAARVLRDAKAWRPATLALITDGFSNRQRNALHGFSDRAHLEAAAGWLGRAQDASGDGGIAGRYLLGSGWTSSYPETTGYCVPTMLALESEAGLPGFRHRAQHCIAFLLRVQLKSGAFPAMEIAENRERPSVFNSAQILHGLTAWHRATGDEQALLSARRAADWILSQQDSDGAWRRNLYGSGRTYSYMAHAGCWLAEFGEYAGEPRYLSAARAHLEWVLTHVDEATGWIEDCGFGDDQQARRAVTHTIGYTIWGVLMMSRLTDHGRGYEVASRAARAVARRLELSRSLAGKLDATWKSAAPYACLTGNAQMALIWLELHHLEPDLSLVSAACKAIDLVKRAQPMFSRNAAFHGGIPGSDPIWGGYIPLAFPNWSVKFFIDALLAKARALQSLGPLPKSLGVAPSEGGSGVARALPVFVNGQVPSRRPRVVLLADAFSPKVEQFNEAWSNWGFRPDAVVVRHRPDLSRNARILEFVRAHGLKNLARRMTGLRPHNIQVPQRRGTIPTSGDSVSAYCAARGIPVVAVRSLHTGADLDRIRSLDADLFVYAGCGILRAPLLEIPRIGTVNAHMGLLPPMRGMNVAEWSVLLGVPVGCSVHLVDAGIDTGEIVITQPVDIAGAPSIDSMRLRVDAAQIALLGEVVQWVLRHGKVPPLYPQRAAEGRQYFAMHDDLRARVEDLLKTGAAPRPNSI